MLDRHDETALLTGAFARDGYRTMAVVNSHNLAERYGFARDFEAFTYISEWGEPAGAPRYLANRAEEVVAKALEWLETLDGKAPFFAFLHFYDVHTDLTPDDRYRERFVRPYDGPVNGTTPQLVYYRHEGTSGSCMTREFVSSTPRSVGCFARCVQPTRSRTPCS